MKKSKKVLLYLLSFLASGTLITYIGLSLLDNFIYSISQSSVIVEGNTSNKITDEIKQVSKIALLEGSVEMQYSYDNKYYAYLKDGNIHINSLEDGKNVTIIKEEKPICYFNILYDKNLIIYFTEDKVNRNSKLVLNTYEIDTERKSEYNKFTIQDFSKIKNMNMSPIINIIYINVETQNSNNTNNIIYRIDLFNSLARVQSGLIIDNMIMLQHEDKIYYEDKNVNIYYNSVRQSMFKEKVDMIGIDYDDNVYFLSHEKKNKVYKVRKNKIVDTIELSDTDIVKTYTNNMSTYIIYPTYIIDISSSEPYKRIGKLSKYVEFESVKGNIMYLKTQNNLLIKSELIK